MTNYRCAVFAACTISTAVSLLSACGGGGGGGGAPASTSSTNTTTTTSPTATKMGVFLDAPVQGLTIKRSDGTTSTTGPYGQFAYNPGETLSFYLGQLKLGDVSAQSMISPLSLFKTTDKQDVRVINLLRLLQSLDSDADLTNGITLSQGTLSSAATAVASLDFTQSQTAFESSASVLALLAAQKPGLSLVSTLAASNHFDQSLSAVDGRGVYDGTLTIAGQAAQDTIGTTSAVFLYSGIYTGANGKTYSVTLSKPVAGKADLQIAGYMVTNTVTGPITTPQLTTDSGALSITTDGLTFTGSKGNKLVLARAVIPATFSKARLYSGAGQATVCPNGALVVTVPDGYGIPGAQYSGVVYPGGSGLSYSLSSTLSFGSAQMQVGAVNFSDTAATFTLPNGKLTLSMVATTTMPSACN